MKSAAALAEEAAAMAAVEEEAGAFSVTNEEAYEAIDTQVGWGGSGGLGRYTHTFLKNNNGKIHHHQLRQHDNI